VRKSTLFFTFLAAAVLALGLVLAEARVRMRGELPHLRQEVRVVQTLGLTDLCLATEARHTRHPSQADWHSAFQSHPGALDHFPSGSVLLPPERVLKGYGAPLR